MNKHSTARALRPSPPAPKALTTFLNIPDPVARRTDISPGAKLVYGAINALCQASRGRCLASDVYLAGMTGISVKQVRRLLKSLAGAELIRRNMRGTIRESIALSCQDEGQIVPMLPPDKLSSNPPSRGTNCPGTPPSRGTNWGTDEMSSPLRSEDEAEEKTSRPSAREPAGREVPGESVRIDGHEIPPGFSVVGVTLEDMTRKPPPAPKLTQDQLLAQILAMQANRQQARIGAVEKNSRDDVAILPDPG